MSDKVFRGSVGNSTSRKGSSDDATEREKPRLEKILDDLIDSKRKVDVYLRSHGSYYSGFIIWYDKHNLCIEYDDYIISSGSHDVDPNRRITIVRRDDIASFSFLKPE